MESVRELEAARAGGGACSRARVPAPGCIPQVPINDKKMYPIYAKCVELDIADLRVRGRARTAQCRWARKTSRLIDEVCWFFPELQVRDAPRRASRGPTLAVKLMLKWPNLYYSTSAFAPEALPRGHHRLREHARRRQDPLRRLLPGRASSLDRIFSELPERRRSATTSGPSSSARTRSAVFGLEDR